MGCPESTARWECLLPGMCQAVGWMRPFGPTEVAIFGFLEGGATIPPAVTAISTIFGSSILPLWSGLGWAEVAPSLAATTFARPECTALWVLRLPGTFPEAGMLPPVGPIGTVISGFSGGTA